MALPEFIKDPRVEPIQTELQTLGTGIVRGELPEFFRGIGDVEAEPIQRARRQLTADITGAGEAAVARRGLGTSPAGVAPIAQAVQRGLTDFDLQNLLRSIQGKQFLLGAGTGILGDVAGRGITQAGQQNIFNLRKRDLELKEAAMEEDDDDLLGDISKISGAIGSVAGLFSGAQALGSLGTQGISASGLGSAKFEPIADKSAFVLPSSGAPFSTTQETIFT